MKIAKKILVIEDSNLVRFEVKRILEAPGIEILELNNVEDFFKFSWRYEGISLLILDIFLPGMDGLTALEKLHLDPVWSYLPVIILTGRSDRQSVQRALRAGAVNYIRKPFSREELLERVEQVLGPLTADEDSPPADLATVIRKEVNRSKRGNTPVSLVAIQVPPAMGEPSRQNDMAALCLEISNTLRDIDTVLFTDRRNLMAVLPLTNAQGASVVIEKIKSRFPPADKEELKFGLVTYPEDGADEQSLLTALRSKIPG